MNTRKFYLQHVLPSLKRFLQGYTVRETGLLHDLDRGAHVAAQLLSLSDFAYIDPAAEVLREEFKNSREYREKSAWKREPLYEVSCDLANAWKHGKVSRDRRTISGLGDIIEICAICRFEDGAGVYYRTQKFTMLKMTNGFRSDLRRVILASARFWAEELIRLNLVAGTPPGLLTLSEYVARNDSQTQLPLTIHGVAGEPMHVQMRCFEFDASRGLVVDARPETKFDGTANLEFKIHKNYSDAPASLVLPVR